MFLLSSECSASPSPALAAPYLGLVVGHGSGQPSPGPDPATSVGAKDCPLSLASGGLFVLPRLRWEGGRFGEVSAEGGGKRKDHTEAGDMGFSPEDMRWLTIRLRRHAHRKRVQGRMEGWPWEVCCGREWERWWAEGRRGLKQCCPVQLIP